MRFTVHVFTEGHEAGTLRKGPDMSAGVILLQQALA